MNKDTWLYWYEGKETSVDEDVPSLSKVFSKAGVSSILDLGCGTGRHCIYLSNLGFRVSGFDWSESAISRAKDLLKSKSADLIVWDMLNFPYPYEDGFFDAVISIKVLHHTTLVNIRKVIEEIERVTKACGYLYLQVPTREKMERLIEQGQKTRRVEEGTLFPLEGEEKGILHHYFSNGELQELLGNYLVKNLEMKNEHYCATCVKK